MIDFDAIVLNPTVDIFGIQCKFVMNRTAPEVAPIIAIGVYSSTPLNVEMMDGTIYSDQQTSLGIRIADVAIVPNEGDQVEIIDARHPAFGKVYWIGDRDYDGQGGVTLLLRLKEPAT